MKNIKMIIHCLGLILIFSTVTPIIAQEEMKANLGSEIHTIEYEGRKYAKSVEGYITLIEKSDDKVQMVSTIIYEGRTYSKSAVGYIKLVEDNEQSKDQSNRNEISNLKPKANSLIMRTLYPNPTKDRLNITFSCENSFNENIIISIISMEGQESQYNVAVSNSEVVSIDISNLDEGVYSLKYNNESGPQSILFIKQ